MKKSKIYNKIGKGLVCLAAMMTVSCGDFLEIEPRNEITFENFWTEKADVEAVLMGCYAHMASDPVVARMLIWGEFRSENIVVGADENADVNLTKILKEGITADNYYTAWADFYTVINRCNTIIKYADKVTEKDPTYKPGELQAHKAEAVAIRSLMYFYLIRTFRDVPYTEEAVSDDNQTPVKAPTDFNTVLGNIIASLEQVKDVVPELYNVQRSADVNTGRITKKAVYALLADMYLWQKNYDKTIEYAQKTIDLKKNDIKEFRTSLLSDSVYFHNYPLIGTTVRGLNNTYGQDFNNNFVSGNGYESLFELVYNGGNNNQSNSAIGRFFGNTEKRPFVIYSSFVGQDLREGVYKVFDKTNGSKDARGYENFKFSLNSINKYSSSSNTYITFSKSDASTSEIASSTSTGVFYAKADVNKSNWIIYRLADVMLLQAEAYAQKISEETPTTEEDKELLDKAFTLVDAVNRRSLMVPSTDLNAGTNCLKKATYKTKTQITDLIYEERHRELLFEGKRYYDLVRRAQREGNTSYLREHCSNKSPETKSRIQQMFAVKGNNLDAIYWPYNQGEVKINEDLRRHQNPAFDSGESSLQK